MPVPTLDNETLKHIAGDGRIEFCLYNPRSKSGMPTWELKIKSTDGTRKIMVIRDNGISISRTEVAVQSFKTRAERNKEIYRLYYDEGLSQMFLANIFNMSQPSISLILKNDKKK